MYFVSWKNDTVIEPGETDATKVEDCSSMNLQVVGNIRPDWYVNVALSLVCIFMFHSRCLSATHQNSLSVNVIQVPRRTWR